MNKIRKICIACIMSIVLDSTLLYAGGFKYVGGRLSFINDNGSVATGFIFVGDKVYYADDSGTVIRATASGTYRMVYDNHYQGQFYVDENGVVSMNVSMDPHWAKINNIWYHYGKNGVLDRNKWILDKESDKIYRVDYDGKQCHGWVADPDTHIEYFYNKDPDDGYLICDSSGTPYEEMVEMIIDTINLNEKYTDTIYNAPNKVNDVEDTPAPIMTAKRDIKPSSVIYAK